MPKKANRKSKRSARVRKQAVLRSPVRKKTSARKNAMPEEAGEAERRSPNARTIEGPPLIGGAFEETTVDVIELKVGALDEDEAELGE